jgi:predicted nucleic-acid-binding Zn-ribbon protein
MKRRAQCPKCGGTRIGHLSSLPDTVGAEVEVWPRYAATMLADGEPTPVGRIEAYLCAGCGYLEEYVADVDELQFDWLQGFSWVGATSTPYR